MGNADLSRLQEPFDRSRIKQREGAGKRMLDYVQSADVIHRVIEATGNEYDWTVARLDTFTMPGRDGPVTCWLCHGILTIPGLGSRSGIGTAVGMNEDSVKSCETDAYKRAAVKFGTALELYFKEGKAPGPVTPPRDYPAEFKARASSMGYTDKMSPLCCALMGKERVQAVDYASALKLSAAEWNRAIDSLAPTKEEAAA